MVVRVCAVRNAERSRGFHRRAGDSIGASSVAIPTGRTAASTPPAIRQLRALSEKDTERRLRDIGDARLELEAAKPAGQGSKSTSGDPGGLERRYLPEHVIARVMALWPRGATADVPNPLANATFTRLTDFEGTEHDAAMSPDGQVRRVSIGSRWTLRHLGYSGRQRPIHESDAGQGGRLGRGANGRFFSRRFGDLAWRSAAQPATEVPVDFWVGSRDCFSQDLPAITVGHRTVRVSSITRVSRAIPFSSPIAPVWTQSKSISIRDRMVTITTRPGRQTPAGFTL